MELNHPNSAFYLAKIEGETVGYLKLNVGDVQNEPMGVTYLEIERVYVDSAYLGQGIGKQLLAKAYEIAQALGKSTVWLGVWEHNEKAILFYKKQGFDFFGKHDFLLGTDPQTDLLMAKTLEV